MDNFFGLKSKGLTQAEVTALSRKYGPNVLPEKKPLSGWWLLLLQLKSPLVYVLLGAGVVIMVIGHLSDAVIILVAVGLNTVLGFIQEERAGKALAALKKLVTNESEVVRDGLRQKVSSQELVPGDWVILDQGTRVPADGNLVWENRLLMDEALLTGESRPVKKGLQGEVSMGTVVASGRGVMQVSQTGLQTKMGRIAKEVQTREEETPLGKQLDCFSRKMVFLILGLVFLVFVLGIIRGKAVSEMFLAAVALAVSSIPEGLLVSLTAVLAIGMQRILKRQGLVRKLASAETLGGVTTICLDKTGTLTEGVMRVVTTHGEQALLHQQAVLANDLDDPLVVAIYNWAKDQPQTAMLSRRYPRLDSLPFSPKERYSMALHQWGENQNMIFVNGAPETLLKLVKFKTKDRQKLNDLIDKWTISGKRVIAFARKEVPRQHRRLTGNEVKQGLKWVGLLAVEDPVRVSVKEALESTSRAGIKTLVITGDYAKTAQYVLKKLGVAVFENEILLGDEVEHLEDALLSEKVKMVKLCARVSPEQKLRIVQALQANGEVVAMMGDGVNDAPALHRADVGVVVATASDVARESADIVLLDSNFATVVAAVEEGRGMFENIRKIIIYLLSDAFAEIVVVVGSIFMNLPLPLSAAQIIWINLVSDGFPGLALTVDPKRRGIMHEPPRPPGQNLVVGWMLALIGTVSLVAGLMAFGVFMIVYRVTNDLVLSRSMAFATLGLNSLAYVFSVRIFNVPFWKDRLLANPWLVLAVLGGFLLQVLPFVLPSGQAFLGVVDIGFIGWLTAGILSIMVFVLVEVFKLLTPSLK